MRTSWLAIAVLVAGLSPAWAATGNPQIRTDHPLYPGELAYSSLDRFARSIIDSGDWGLGLGNSERDVALKLWLWKITHTLHDFTPKIWTPLQEYTRAKFGTHSPQHPIRPDPSSPPWGFDEDQDSLRWTFSYGYALCTTLHGNIGPQIEAIGRALGKEWRSRCINFPGDTNHEIYFAGKWRAFDVNAANLLWSSNDPRSAELMSYKDAFGPQAGPKRLDLLDNGPKFAGQYLPKLAWGDIVDDGKPRHYSWMRSILEHPEIAWTGDEFDQKHPMLWLMHNMGYNACPITYGLKKGETFTRWFSGDDARRELVLPKPIWWGANIKGGPGSLSYYAHYLRDLPELCKDVEPLVFSTESPFDNRYALRDFKEATHGNGLFDWQPNLAAGDWKEGAVAIEGPVVADGGGITAEEPAHVTFAFFSPYTIAAMPSDDTDPALDGATNGAILEARTEGNIPVDVSTNNGLTFRPAGTLKEDGRIDFTDAVKGRNHYLLRVELDKGRRLETLRLRTVVTTCRAIYPKLKSGRTTVTYQADGLEGLRASPDLTSQATATAPGSFVSQEDLVWVGYSSNGYIAWGTDKDVASCVYKVTSPKGALAGISAAAMITWPSPTSRDAWGEIAVGASPDGPWTTIRRVNPQAEDLVDKNVVSSYWIYGTADLARQDLETAYVRFRFAGAGKPCGIRYLHLFGTYQVGNASPLAVTYRWKSGDEVQDHTETIPSGRLRHSYTIDTGKDVRNTKVVFAVAPSR